MAEFTRDEEMEIALAIKFRIREKLEYEELTGKKEDITILTDILNKLGFGFKDFRRN